MSAEVPAAALQEAAPEEAADAAEEEVEEEAVEEALGGIRLGSFCAGLRWHLIDMGTTVQNASWHEPF